MRLSIAALCGALFLILAQPVAAADRQGSFRGASGHATSGTVVVSANGGRATVALQRNFSFDGAPDPRFAFGTANGIDRRTIFGRLQRNSGAQSYSANGFDPARHTHVYLWCERFNVPLGLARLR